MVRSNQVSSMEPIILSVLIKYTQITNHLIAKASFLPILMSFKSKIDLLNIIISWIRLKIIAFRWRLFNIQRCKIETRFWWALMWLVQKPEACSVQVNSQHCNKIKLMKDLQIVEVKLTATRIFSTMRRARAHILRATTRAKEKGRYPSRAWWKYRTCKIRSWGRTQRTICSSTSSLTQARALVYIATNSLSITVRTSCHHWLPKTLCWAAVQPRTMAIRASSTPKLARTPSILLSLSNTAAPQNRSRPSILTRIET